MNQGEPRTPEAERNALDAMVHSDGWAILKEIVADGYGPARQIQHIDDVMTTLRPGDDERAVVTQIRAAAKAANDVITRVESRLTMLQGAAKAKTEPGAVFGGFRRGPRR